MSKPIVGKPIFVFTTSLLGDHHRTASGRHAIEYYNPNQACFGPSVDCFAIPTLAWDGDPLPLYRVMPFVHEFILVAMSRPKRKFLLPVFEDHTPEQIAPLFKDAPKNVLIPPVYEELL